MEEIVYRPIGIIRSPLRGEDHIPPQPSHIRNVEGTVELLPEYAGGLKDLEDFSHLVPRIPEVELPPEPVGAVEGMETAHAAV